MAIYFDFVTAMLTRNVVGSDYDPAIHDTLNILSFEFDHRLFASMSPHVASNHRYVVQNCEFKSSICFAFDFGAEQIVVLVEPFKGWPTPFCLPSEYMTFWKRDGGWLNMCPSSIQAGYIEQKEHDEFDLLCQNLVIRALYLHLTYPCLRYDRLHHLAAKVGKLMPLNGKRLILPVKVTQTNDGMIRKKAVIQCPEFMAGNEKSFDVIKAALSSDPTRYFCLTEKPSANVLEYVSENIETMPNLDLIQPLPTFQDRFADLDSRAQTFLKFKHGI